MPSPDALRLAPRLAPRPASPNPPTPSTPSLDDQEQAVLTAFRRWRSMQEPGHSLTVELRIGLGPNGEHVVHGGAHEGSLR